MSDTLVQNGGLTQKRREAAIARAKGRGFSEFHLIDMHVRIAEIVARAHAEALTEAQAADPAQSTGYVISCMAYDGQECPEIIDRAIIALADKEGAGHAEALRDIALLLCCFADFSHSYPDGYTSDAWRNLLIDISVELTIGTDVPNSRDTRRRALSRLVKVFPHLWS